MGNCTGIPMYTLFLDRPTWFTEIYEIDGNTVPPFQHGSQVKMVILLFGACTMDTSRPGGQAARRPGGQPHFRLGQIFACNMYLASLKGVMKEAPQLVSVSVIDSLQLCMVHHGSSWFGSLFIPIGPIGRSVSQENVAQSRVRPGPEDQLMVVVLEVTWCRDLMFLFNIIYI